MAHVRLKPTREFKINFHPSELEKIEIPKESKDYAKQYIQSKELVGEGNGDLMLMFEDKVIYGFDYIHGKTKRIIVELNPVTIFYSNAVMSFGNLNHYKEVLISASKDVAKFSQPGEPVNLTHSGMYFQLAINCIINLQAVLESFANSIIPDNYPYLDKTGKPVKENVVYKLTYVLPIIKKKTFELSKNKKHRNIIKDLVSLRNRIIHLKPDVETKTTYKRLYRELLDFDFSKALIAVRTFINFYEPELIEECECGQNFYFYSGNVEEEEDL